MMDNGFNLNGGLTLVAMPGFEELCQELKGLIEDKKPYENVDVVVPRFGLRASEEPYVQLAKDHVGGHYCVVVTSGPGTYQMLGQTQFCLKYLAGRRAGRISLFTGYLPLTRSDKDEGDLELALLPAVVDFFKDAARGPQTPGGLNRIIAVDLHAQQETSIGGMGLITEVSLVRRVLTKAIEDAQSEYPGMPIALAFPDENAYKRFDVAITKVREDMALDLPIIYAGKRRENSRKSKLVDVWGDVESAKGACVISADDEGATLGSTAEIAKALKNRFGAVKFHGSVIHGVLCSPAPDRLADKDSGIDCLYIANTIPSHNRPELKDLLDSGKLRVVRWVNDLATIIHLHHCNTNFRNIQ